MKFYFCEKCGKRIMEDELAKSFGQDKSLASVYCRNCAGGTPTLVTETITSKHARGRLTTRGAASTQTARRSSKKLASAPCLEKMRRRPDVPSTQSRRKKLAILAGGSGVLLILAGLILLANDHQAKPETLMPRKRNKKDSSVKGHPRFAEQRSLSGVHRAPRPSASPPSFSGMRPEQKARAAFERLEKKLQTFSAVDNRGRAAAVKAFLNDYGNTMIAARARSLLRLLDAPPSSESNPKRTDPQKSNLPPPSPGLKDGNLALNPSAEELGPDGKPKSWGRYSGTDLFEWGATEAEAHGGKRCAFLKITGFDERGVNNSALLLGNSNGYSGEQAITVEPNTSYFFSLFLKGHGYPKKIGVFFQGWQKGLTASTKGRQRIATSPSSVEVTSQWQRVSGAFKTLADTERGVLAIGRWGHRDREILPGAEVFVDDVYLGLAPPPPSPVQHPQTTVVAKAERKVDEQPPIKKTASPKTLSSQTPKTAKRTRIQPAMPLNWVTNPSAEEVRDKLPVGWGFYEGSGGCEWGVTSAEAHSGNHSMYYKVTGFPGGTSNNNAILIGNSNGYSGEKAFEVKAKTRYYFSLHLKGKGFRGSLPIITVLGWKKGMNGMKGRHKIKTSVGAIPVPRQWTQFQGYFDTSAKTARAVLYVGGWFKKDKSAVRGATLYVDDVYVGPSSSSYEAYAKVAREMTARPETDGYRLIPQVVHALRKNYKASAVKKASIMLVGSFAAQDKRFVVPLTRKQLTHFTIAKNRETLRFRNSITEANKRLAGDLKRHKPEIIILMFGISDLIRGRKPAELSGPLSEMVSAIQGAGSIPVLCTLPVPLVGTGEQVARIKELNSLLRKTAESMKLPMVDVQLILNPADPKEMRKRWSSWNLASARPSRVGYEKINEPIGKLIQILEKYVCGRRRDSPKSGQQIQGEEEEEE